MKFLGILLCCLLIQSCGSGKSPEDEKMASVASKYNLTQFQFENGIGPITDKVTLGRINNRLAEKGKAIFDMKCIACHKMDDRFVGPSVRYVSERRTPEYILNMILNPDEMVEKHPLARKMLANYMNKMTFQNVTQDEAMQMLHYFRQVAKEGKDKKIPEGEKFPSLSDIK